MFYQNLKGIHTRFKLELQFRYINDQNVQQKSSAYQFTVINIVPRLKKNKLRYIATKIYFFILLLLKYNGITIEMVTDVVRWLAAVANVCCGRISTTSLPPGWVTTQVCLARILALHTHTRRSNPNVTLSQNANGHSYLCLKPIKKIN